MDIIDPNEINKANKDKWSDNVLVIVDLLPNSLKYMLIFAAATFIGSATAYYINPTGLLCGLLVVLIYRWK